MERVLTAASQIHEMCLVPVLARLFPQIQDLCVDGVFQHFETNEMEASDAGILVFLADSSERRGEMRTCGEDRGNKSEKQGL